MLFFLLYYTVAVGDSRALFELKEALREFGKN